MRFLALCFLLAYCSTSFANAAAGCDLSPQRGKFLRVNYTVWVDPDLLYPLDPLILTRNPLQFSANTEVTVPEGANFLQLMEIAQLADDRFKFEAEHMQISPPIDYILHINNFYGEIDRNWKVYELSYIPDFYNNNVDDPGTFVSQNLNEIIIKDGIQYLAYLRRFPIE